MTANGRRGRVVVGVFLAALGVGCATGGGVRELPEQGEARIAALYARHCAFCHGDDGGGDGLVAEFLFPRPRDFGSGRFRLVSTTNGVPTDADLEGCLVRGMPGAAMPAFGWLPADDVAGLAQHVRRLAIERMATELVRRYQAAGQQLSAAEAHDVATWRLTPGEPVVVPPVAAPTDALLAKGRALYLERCAACHGADGEGQQPDRAWADFDGLYWARDLRAGRLKGGADAASLGHRILAGMPGVAMPPARFTDADDAAALIAYVQSLLPPDADRIGVQVRQQLRAARVDHVVVDPDDPAFATAVPIDVALMALAYRDDCIDRVTLRAIHDGARVAIDVAWDDPTRDDRAIGGASRFADQCALQLSSDHLPPLFGMGGHEDPVDIWHWAAFRARDVTGALDLLGTPASDASPRHAPGLVRPAEVADQVEARGVDAPRAVDEAVLDAHPRYRDGRWHVVFVRDLAVAPGHGLPLAPGGAVQLACAVWNGSADDRGVRKAISIWHELVLAP